MLPIDSHPQSVESFRPADIDEALAALEELTGQAREICKNATLEAMQAHGAAADLPAWRKLGEEFCAKCRAEGGRGDSFEDYAARRMTQVAVGAFLEWNESGKLAAELAETWEPLRAAGEAAAAAAYIRHMVAVWKKEVKDAGGDLAMVQAAVRRGFARLFGAGWDPDAPGDELLTKLATVMRGRLRMQARADDLLKNWQTPAEAEAAAHARQPAARKKKPPADGKPGLPWQGMNLSHVPSRPGFLALLRPRFDRCANEAKLLHDNRAKLAQRLVIQENAREKVTARVTAADPAPETKHVSHLLEEMQHLRERIDGLGDQFNAI